VDKLASVDRKDGKMKKVVFGIVGSGWRTEFYLRIARELPDLFEVCGVVTRSSDKGKELGKTWGVKSFGTIDAMLAHTSPGFVVVSVPWDVAPVATRELHGHGMAILSETPPAPDLDGLVEINRLVESGAKIQVAEQYHLQPLHAARIAIANSGRLGNVTEVQLSVCHGYHAMSLLRKLLGIRYENARISTVSFSSPIVGSPDRDGNLKEEKSEVSRQVIACLDFGDKFGVYDFTDAQYFSWVRSQHLLVRGEKGEINDAVVRYMKDFRTPVTFDLKRMNAGENGNLEGLGLKGILAGEEWIYVNPFRPGKLTDDEIAIASCLLKMDRYVKEGEAFYSLADASQDHYLSMIINEAVRTNTVLCTESQPWS
jgi:predicted dehydrogenase